MLGRVSRVRRPLLPVAVVLALILPAAAQAAPAALSAGRPAGLWPAFDHLADRLWSGLAGLWPERSSRPPAPQAGPSPDPSGQLAAKAGPSADPSGQPGSNQTGAPPDPDGYSETDEGPSADPSG